MWRSLGQQAQLLGEEGICTWDGLGVDIAAEAIILAEQAQCLDHPLGGIIRVPQHGGGEKEPLNIVAAVELDGEFGQLPGSKSSPGRIVGPAVDTVLAVVGADVRIEDLQEGDAPPVSGEGVAAARRHGGAQPARPSGPVQSAGGAGGVILGGVRQDGQLVHQAHGVSLP